MNDSLNIRVFKFKNSNNDSSITDPTMKLRLLATPILSITDFDIEHKAVNSKDITNTEPINTPYDPNLDGRFTFVAKAPSFYSMMGYSLYWDSKYSDLIVIPDLDQYPIESLVNATITFDSYRPGTKLVKSNISYSIETGDPDKITVPAPTAPDTVTRYDINYHGIRTRTKPDIIKTVSVGNVFESANVISVLKLSRVDVFGDTPFYTAPIVPESIQKHRIFNPTYNSPDYLYIPIPI